MMGRLIASVAALIWASAALGHDLGLGETLVTRLDRGEGHIVQTDRFRAELRPEASGGEFISWALTLRRASDGAEGYALVEDSDLYIPDDVTLLESSHCGMRLVEVVLRLPPPRMADIMEFSYIRVIFGADDMAPKAQFFDTSVSALNAVVTSNMFASEQKSRLYVVECDSDGLVGLSLR